MARRHNHHLRLVAVAEAGSDTGVAPDPVMTIDCDECIRRDTDECDDCVVSYLVDHDPAAPVVFGPQEQRAVDLLADAGLIPRSRFESAHGVA